MVESLQSRLCLSEARLTRSQGRTGGLTGLGSPCWCIQQITEIYEGSGGVTGVRCPAAVIAKFRLKYRLAASIWRDGRSAGDGSGIPGAAVTATHTGPTDQPLPPSDSGPAPVLADTFLAWFPPCRPQIGFVDCSQVGYLDQCSRPAFHIDDTNTI